MPGAVIYGRVSTKEQVENNSLPTQLRDCREHCARNGYEVVREFVDDGVSAKTLNRPQLKKLLTFCRQSKKRVSRVVVYKVDRLARHKHGHAVIRALLAGLGIELRSVMEPIDDTSSGQLLEGILAAFAQFDNDQKGERSKAGMTTSLRNGRWTFKGPRGYTNAGNRAAPSLIPDPEIAPLIRLAFQRIEGGATRREALAEVTAVGLRGSRGRRLSNQSFIAILKNPVYCGRIEVPSLKVSVVGDWEPLVTERTFRAVQARLNGRERLTRHRNHPDFPLRRFVRCGRCRTPLTGSWSRGRGGKYAYYRCRQCGSVSARVEAMEKTFTAFLERLQPDSANMRLFREIVLDAWKGRNAQARQVRSRLEQRLSTLQDRLDQLDATFIYRQAIDRLSYDRQKDLLREEKAVVELEWQDARLEELDVEAILSFAENALTNVVQLWKRASLDQKLRLQWALFPKGVDFDGEEFGTSLTCLAFNRMEGSGGLDDGMASPRGLFQKVGGRLRRAA